MRHSVKSVMVIFAFMGIIFFAFTAFADPAIPPEQSENLEEAELGTNLAVEDLEAQNGAKDIQIDKIAELFSNANNEGSLAGNSIFLDQSSMTNGSNTIESGAFAGMNGIGTVIQNTGNQVIIQNATIVDVIMQ